MRHLKQLLFAALASSVMLISGAQMAQAFTAVDCSLLTSTQCSTVKDDRLSGGRANNTIWNVVSLVLLVLGGVAVIVIIIAAIRLAGSNGDAKRVTAAKTAILNAVIGLLIALSAGILVRFVTGYFINFT